MAEINPTDAIPATNASNTTRYFNLPLFIATDKPSWLVDWNGAMNEIDSILQDINNSASGAESDVETVVTQVSQLSGVVSNLESLVETAVSDVAQMQTTVDSHEERIDSVETDLITQNNLIKTLSDAVVAMQTLVNQLDNTVSTIQTDVTSAQTAIATLQNYYSALDSRVTTLENSVVTPNFYDLMSSGDYTATNFLSNLIDGHWTATSDGYIAGMAYVSLQVAGTPYYTGIFLELPVSGTNYYETIACVGSTTVVSNSLTDNVIGVDPTFVKAGTRLSIQNYSHVDFSASPRTLKFFTKNPQGE